MNKNSFKDYFLPISILIAAVLIAGSLLWTAGSTTGDNNQAPTNAGDSSAESVADVTSEDHIRGNVDAPIKIIEFSDLECPYCQRFHSVMSQIVEDYDEVAWVYRQFPLESIHPKAVEQAEASECVASLAGNDTFWDFVDLIFEVTPGNNGLDNTKLPDYAEQVGVDKQDFVDCMDSEQFADEVDKDINDAINAGAEGTPFSVVITPEGEYIPIGGYVDYGPLSSLMDQIIEEEL